MLLRTMSHFDPHRKNALSHAHMWWGFRSFEIGQDCYANPQLLMTNRQSALGQFSIGRVGQFSISADTMQSCCGMGLIRRRPEGAIRTYHPEWI